MYLEICAGAKILDEICSNVSLVAVGFVVEIEGLGLRVHLRRVLDEVFDCLNVRECFQAKFRVEATPEAIEDLVFF